MDSCNIFGQKVDNLTDSESNTGIKHGIFVRPVFFGHALYGVGEGSIADLQHFTAESSVDHRKNAWDHRQMDISNLAVLQEMEKDIIVKEKL